MDKRKIIGFLIIFVGLIILIGIIYFMFFYGPTSEVVPGDSEGASQPTLSTSEVEPTNKGKAVIEVKTPAEKEIRQTDLGQLAMAFAERLGSYSNQSDYGNIQDLKIFMSENMLEWADNYISESRAEEREAEIYEGITTKAITREIKQINEALGLAEVLVKTQRKKAVITTGNTSTYYQDIVIEFVRENDIWKVDKANWQ